MRKKVLESDWMPSGGITLEENATAAIKHFGNVLVVAGPGAGKTELLAQKAGYLFQTNACKYPQKILAISFKTDAAANLKERVHSRYGHGFSTRFSSLTYDAFAKRVLDQFRTALPNELTPEKDYVIGEKSIIAGAFSKAGFVNNQKLTPSEIVSYYENTISATQLPLDKDSLGSAVWRLLVKGFDDNPPCLTFKMISMLSMHILITNPYILKSLQATYSYVFLDEFQDTTSLQYSLIKICFENTNSEVTAVGDGKQRIMVWAGAKKTIFEDFQHDFQATKILLQMNHRSAPRLVNLQRLMYKYLQTVDIDLKTSEKWKENDGNIKLFLSENEKLEAKYIADDIIEITSRDVLLNDICILVKQLPDNYTNVLMSELTSKNIKARIETDYQDLLKEFIVNLIINVLIVSIRRRSPNEWEYVTNAMVEIKGIDPSEDSNLYHQEHMCLVELLNQIFGKLDVNTSKGMFKEVIVDILRFFDVRQIRAMYPVYSQGDFLKTTINKLVKLLWKEYEGCKDWETAIENFQGLNSISIMTIHKSKGLEYNTVYFIGLEDGAFWNFKNQPDEDRCTFFVALSRAKERLAFSFCSYRSKVREPYQKREDINEFFELLQTPDISDIVICK